MLMASEGSEAVKAMKGGQPLDPGITDDSEPGGVVAPPHRPGLALHPARRRRSRLQLGEWPDHQSPGASPNPLLRHWRWRVRYCKIPATLASEPYMISP